MRMNFPAMNIEKSSKAESVANSESKASRQKPHLSASEIREKLEAHKAEKNRPEPAAKVEVASTKLPDPKEVVEAAEPVVPNTSLMNDPKAPETQEKLRQLITNGGFNFSDKERKVLGEVLKV